MRWLLLRALLILLLLGGICGAIVLIARANPAPSRLQALGFDVCEGEPCFRGIRAGMGWDTLRARYPKEAAFLNNSRLLFPVEFEGNAIWIDVQSSSDKRYAEAIFIRTSNDYPLPMNIGEVVAKYGPPCRVAGYRGLTPNAGRNQILLIYPRIMVSASIDNSAGMGDRFRLDPPIQGIVMAPMEDDACNGFNSYLPAPLPWHGFASAELYLAEYRRIFGETP